MRACHTVGGADSEYLDQEAWDRLVQQSPEEARRRVETALEDPSLDPTQRATLLQTLGRSLLELGNVGDAEAAVRAAVDVVRGGGCDQSTAGSVSITAAIVLAEAGEIEEALAILDGVAAACSGPMLGRVRLQQGLVLHHAGRLTESLSALDQSDRVFAQDGTDQERFRVHVNRGVVLLQQGQLDSAEVDFVAAAGLAQRLGMTAAEGQCHANTGVLYGRARRLVEALDAFARAEVLLERAGRPARVTTWMEIDRAEVLMHSGLGVDAVEAARRALDAAGASGNDLLYGDALMMCARTELAAGSVGAARRTALAARDHLVRSGRDDMTAHADAIVAQAALRATGPRPAEAFAIARTVVGALRANAWHEQADELVLEAVRAAWRLGSWDEVADEVAALSLHSFGERRDLALAGWFAEAIARHLGGDSFGSIEACTRGLDFLDDITAEAVDLEARSAAMRLGDDLSRWVIEMAAELDQPDLVLKAGEGTRARALHEELEGRERHRPLSDEGGARLLAELRGRLHGRCLVHWLVVAGRVRAVVCDEAGNRLVDVADLREVIRARDRLTVWLDRAAAEPDGAADRALRTAGQLDELLIAPLELPDSSIVVVPVDELHGVPWSGLPSLAHRSMVLSPSCRLWLDADRRSSVPVATVGYVAGPNLTDDLERNALRRHHVRVDEATGAGATTASVRAMLGGHDLVHIAAHGRFRADRPLLSTLELADGKVALHESVPPRVGAQLAVLSSCEGGAHLGTGGSEVLGLASVLLARGAASVLAPLTVVRDLECGEFVAEVHAELASGTRFGAAVAAVRSRWLVENDLSRWAVASSFTCFGSGATHVAPHAR